MWLSVRTPAALRLQTLCAHLPRPGHQVAPASTASHSGPESRTRAVIFDMGGVLTPSPLGLWKEYEARLQLPAGTILKTLVSGGDTGAWASLERGDISLPEFAARFSDECTKMTGREVIIDHARFVPGADRRVAMFAEMLDAIRCIRAEGIKTALLTNNWLTAPGHGFCPIDTSVFDVVVQSCLVRMRKPDPRIYLHALQQLDVAPEEAVFLDDLGHNLKVAQGLGIRTIKVESALQAVTVLQTELGFGLRCYVEGTTTVPARLHLETRSVKTYLNWALKLHDKVDPVIRCFDHGQSNPTYYIRYANKDLVLRKKPPGKLLPSAHAVEREYRVMKALGEHGVPVPRVLGLCDEAVLLGTPFYVMEYVPGRIFKQVDLPNMTPADRRAIYSAMNKVLAKIHSVDIEKAKLSDYGKQGDYMRRNYQRWARQYEASKTRHIPAMERLMTWLPDNFPATERCTVVHGDFRLDNLIFHPTRLEVVAVLDWELSTLGDPLTDLATNCLAYYLPTDFPLVSGFSDLDLAALGIPSVDEYVREYAARVRLDGLDSWRFYVAFACFRFAAICQGVAVRFTQGQAVSSSAGQADALVEAIAELAWHVITDTKGPSMDIQPAPVSANDSNTASNTDSNTASNTDSASITANTRDIPGAVPVAVAGLSPRVRRLHADVRRLVREDAIPLEQELLRYHSHPDTRWTIHPELQRLKAKAKAAGLWNLFLPKESDPHLKYGAGLTNVEYAYLCEEMGHCLWAPELFNCSAPDTGNMEVFVRYASGELKDRWLKPLLEGEIRSCFAMTEPAVASSDATNIQASIKRDGDDYVINGHKWWTSGALDPRCAVCIFMGKTDPDAPRHRQQSMIVVPMDAPGVRIVRPLSVFGSEDPPHGHAEVLFENVRVPRGNILLGEGRGFEIAQGRLGPGRIHHCMRLIGHCERALTLMLDRVQERVAFGKPLVEQGTILADVAQCRMDIEQARLLVLKAAHMMDTVGNKVAAPEIAMIKVTVPNMALAVLDRTMQAFGGMGVSGDTPLASFYAAARSLRLADGPDEVHTQALARMELRRHNLSKL